ncbi:MAG: phosphotransferase [Bifidobacterium sp.]|nr:phosphotransferase [Bifidobacterium sp.]
MLAALASATMPNTPVVGVRASEQGNDTDEAAGIDQAVVQDARGNLYNVYATNTPQGKKRLAGRARAARVAGASRELAGLGFAVDTVVAVRNAKPDDPDDTSVLITVHPSGQSRQLELFTLDDCASVGTAIGAIHRLRPNFLVEAKYPAFTTGQIRTQLTSWIQRLRQAGHVPQEITDSWSRILETEGLWSFQTCPVHGGFSDGDIIFQSSTITTITNWQGMQVNDPARDLAWIFSKLDETHRNAVIAAYGRILGNRLDDLIMLRANLWVQMEQVGDFIQALNRGDNAHIVQFKAQVDRLAHQLGVSMHRNQARAAETGTGTGSSTGTQGRHAAPDTVTVNTLLAAEQDRQRRMAAAASSTVAAAQEAAAAQAAQSGSLEDITDQRPIIGERHSSASMAIVEEDRTASRSIDAIGVADSDSTASRPVAVQSHSSSETMIIGFEPRDTTASGQMAAATGTGERTAQTQRPAGDNGKGDAQTVLIPLLEREERAMRDARAGLGGQTGTGERPVAPRRED